MAKIQDDILNEFLAELEKTEGFFIQDGLSFVSGPYCPLCDTAWNIDELRAHLAEKLNKSAAAKERRDRILQAGQSISTAAVNLRDRFAFVSRLPETEADLAGRLQHWAGELSTFSEGLKSFDGVLAAKDRIENGWAQPPANLDDDLKALQTPQTQFIITTHDQVWARQIRSEGLIGAKAAVAFHHWTVETGPVLDEVAEVWDQIDKDLAKNDVPAAASRSATRGCRSSHATSPPTCAALAERSTSI